MQNKQALIGIIAAAVILLGAGGVFLYSKNHTAKPAQNSTTATGQKNDTSSMNGSLFSLLSSGKTQQCVFNYDSTTGSSTNGTVYIDGTKFRGDFDIKNSNGSVSQVSMVRVGDINYIWGDSFPGNTGIKMTLSADQFEKDSQAKNYFDPAMKTDYKCNPWTADASLFVPPTTVKFSDMSEMMQGLMKTTATPTGTGKITGSSSQCSVCNSLSGTSKTACLQQLHCQ